jgi:hypothetical protein
VRTSVRAPLARYGELRLTERRRFRHPGIDTHRAHRQQTGIHGSISLPDPRGNIRQFDGRAGFAAAHWNPGSEPHAPEW